MIHNVTIAPGAVYWIDKFVDKGEITYKYNVDNQPITKTYQLFDASLGWDMNYQFFDFNEFSQYNNADACPIKLIKTN